MNFKNKITKCITLSICCFSITSTLNATSFSNYYPSHNWIVKTPSEMGYSKIKFENAKNYFENMGITAFMLIDDGYIVADWGDSQKVVNCHSIRKSYLSALIGIYNKEGKIDISSTLESLGIEDIDSLSSIEKQAKVSDLLKARSGVYHPAAYETKKMRNKRPSRGSHLPNTFYYYNNWDFNVLGTIFEQESSEDIFEAFYKHIAKPINMKDFYIDDGKHIKEKVSLHSAYEFNMSARDRARFGLLYMRDGMWQGKQIIPKEWIEKSIMPYSNVSKGVGYGYMWWTSTGKWHLGSKIKGKAYSARGYWGQYIVILPQEKLVIVQVSDKKNGDNNAYGKKFNKLLKMILDAKHSPI